MLQERGLWRLLLTSVFLMTRLLAGAQDAPVLQPLAREISLTTENDAYLFRRQDAYYTNGVFLRLGTAAQRKKKKLIRSYELGQLIYTPRVRKTQSIKDIDRPYCGFLFARYTRAAFSEQDAVFQYSATLGVVGDASLGEDVQNSYHALLGYGRFTGWQYQVKNALGVDLGMAYARTAWEDSTWAKIVPAAQVSLGTNYTNAKLGAYFCFGSFEKNSNSALWNARVQKKPTDLRKRTEFFAYWYPQCTFQAYNATIQGGLFSKGKGAVLAVPNRVLLQHTTGLCIAQDSWTVKMEIVFQDREALSQQTTQQYGSFQLSYRFR